jgi:hypothetical protein
MKILIFGKIPTFWEKITLKPHLTLDLTVFFRISGKKQLFSRISGNIPLKLPPFLCIMLGLRLFGRWDVHWDASNRPTDWL